MNHGFNVNIAKELGVNSAIILENFIFWCAKNEANGKHIYNGVAWTYNSKKALQELFPYLTYNQIYRAIETLVTNGYLIKGNFNEDSRDRTLWYTTTEKAKCKYEICTMHNASMQYAICDNAQSYKGTDINYNNDILSDDSISTKANIKDINLNKKEKENFEKKSEKTETRKEKAERSFEKRKKDFQNDIAPYLETYGRDMLNDFFSGGGR